MAIDCVVIGAGPAGLSAGVALQVVVAAGDQNVPAFPGDAVKLPGDIVQCHTASYRNPAGLPAGRVLVVGSGQSGCQIAHDLRTAGREVILATCAAPRMPAQYRGRETFEWLVAAGFFSNRQIQFDDSVIRNIEFGNTFAKRFLALSDDFITRRGIPAPAAETDETGGSVPISPLHTIDLSEEGISAVVWCTGFTGGFGWLDASFLDDAGMPRRNGAASTAPGLWYAGIKWMIRRASGILLGFPGDASIVADAVASHLGS